MTEDDPKQTIERMETLMAEATKEKQSRIPYEDRNPIARDHLDTIRREGRQTPPDDEE